MEYYKVLRRQDEGLFSAIIDGEAKVQYKVKEWTYADKRLISHRFGRYGLTVFCDFANAIDFCQHVSVPTNQKLSIFKCMIEGKISVLPCFISVNNILDVLYCKKENFLDYMHSNCIWPAGTVMTNAVFLTEEIENIDFFWHGPGIDEIEVKDDLC